MSTDLENLEQAKALDHIRDLLTAHWREAQDAQDDDGKFGIGFRVTFDRGAAPTKLKVTCRISKTFTDEVESVLETRTRRRSRFDSERRECSSRASVPKPAAPASKRSSPFTGVASVARS